MRVEFGLQLTDVALPRFAVEAVEGIGKLFTLATLVLNVLETKPGVEVVFHGLNPEDPERKIEGFIEIHGDRKFADDPGDISLDDTDAIEIPQFIKDLNKPTKSIGS